MNLKEFLDRSFYKEEVQDICLALDLRTTGDKDELVKRILRFLRQEGAEKEIRNGKSVILDAVRKLNKDMLQSACEDADLDSSGTKDQLLRRVTKNLEWPVAMTKTVSETQDKGVMDQQTTLDESYAAEPALPEGLLLEGPAEVKEQKRNDFENFLIRYFDKDRLRTLAERTGYKVSGSKETIAERIVEIFQKLPDDEIGIFLNRIYWYLDDWRKACKATGISDSGSKTDAVFRLLREIPEVSSRMKPEHRDEIGLKIGEKPSDLAEEEQPSKAGLLGRVGRLFAGPEMKKPMNKATEERFERTEVPHPKVVLEFETTIPPLPVEQHVSELPLAQEYVLSPHAKELPLDENRHALFRRVVCEIQGWTPQGSYRTEETYRYDLVNHLKTRGYVTRVEAGTDLVDILVEDQIPIEVKKTPKSRAEYDRFAGQLLRFADVYACAIGIVCDVKGKEAYKVFFDQFIRMKGNRKIMLLEM